MSCNGLLQYRCTTYNNLQYIDILKHQGIIRVQMIPNFKFLGFALSTISLVLLLTLMNNNDCVIWFSKSRLLGDNRDQIECLQDNCSSEVYFVHTSAASVSKCPFISILLKKKYRATPLYLRLEMSISEESLRYHPHNPQLIGNIYKRRVCEQSFIRFT